MARTGEGEIWRSEWRRGREGRVTSLMAAVSAPREPSVKILTRSTTKREAGAETSESLPRKRSAFVFRALEAVRGPLSFTGPAMVRARRAAHSPSRSSSCRGVRKTRRGRPVGLFARSR
jgi:hypothetical protein